MPADILDPAGRPECPRCNASLLEGHVERVPLELSFTRRWLWFRLVGTCPRCGYRRTIRKGRR